jgi:Na+-driven multidrug efflux pump
MRLLWWCHVAVACVFPVEGFVVQSAMPSIHSLAFVSSPFLALKGIPKNRHLSCSTEADQDETEGGKERKGDSINEMIKFALPALGIFLSAPLLSNIDNAFVGKTVGTSGLAALSPATICTDQVLYLFSFLSRATTGIVSRAYSSEGDEESKIERARNAGSTPLTFGLLSGAILSIMYALFTPKMLSLLKVDMSLRTSAAAYVYWRGAITWAALAQSVCLSILLATRDAVTPLKIIALAGLVNIIGDAIFCVFPFRWGCAGASAATAFATLFSSGQMIRVLKKKKLLPRIQIPNLSELKGLFSYVGPLFVIVISRLFGFVNMQRRAMTFGTLPLAAYQICTNALIFFLLFGEPLSQLHQTKLPALIDSNSREETLSTMKKVLSLSVCTSLIIGAVCFGSLTFGSALFASDVVVQSIVKETASSVSFAVMMTIMGTALDGAMLASRDFNFIIWLGLFTMCLQLAIVSQSATLPAIYASFALRLVTYSVGVITRVTSGRGALGRVLRLKPAVAVA